MKNVKRVEIVIEAIEQNNLIKVLNQVGVEGYTIYHHVGGQGERGERAGSAFGEKFENVAFVIACNENTLDKLIAAVRPILKNYGGICLVSDAQWVLHND
jgi:nitrogen regulatory protein PII